MPRSTKKSDDTSPNVLQLKITLNDSSPRIWRRIQVPTGYSFFDLHVAIQDAMGWTDSHLHAFRIAQKGTSTPLTIQYPQPDDWDSFEHDTLDERLENIADHFGKTIKQCVYDYDFGDSWEHTILFEGEKPKQSGTSYPQCLNGKHACPPEDCGGIGGYDRLQEIMRHPKHPEHAEMLNWLNLNSAKNFDPSEFDSHEVIFEDPKQRLKEYRKEVGI